MQVHRYLRSLLLDGSLEPGSEFSQVELAKALGVSRTPLREALRMLQEEGLVDAERNRKSRISGFNPAALDAVYASRIALESVAIFVTVRLRTSELMEELEELLTGMEAVSGPSDLEAFQPLHRRFHARLVSLASPVFVDLVHVHQERAERYWRLLNRTEDPPHTRRNREHRDILAAVLAKDGEAAAAQLAHHLGRSALSLTTYLAPHHDTPATRAALQIYADKPR